MLLHTLMILSGERAENARRSLFISMPDVDRGIDAVELFLADSCSLSCSLVNPDDAANFGARDYL